MITLWGRKTSINVQKVMWLLEELGLEYERIDRGGAFGGLNDPDYVKLNPTRLVPTLKDGDLVLWESNAILRYLADAYGAGTSFGGTAAQRAAADKWMEWYQSSVYGPFQAVFYQMVRLPIADRNADTMNKMLDTVHAQFALFDSMIQTQPFINGHNLTLGDIPMAACLYRYHTMGLDRPPFARLDAYYQRLTEHAPYRNNVMINYDSLRPKT
jgi:glutathione S-transferase